MMPINFKFQRLSPEELKYRLVKSNGKHHYESPYNRSNQSIQVNKTPFLDRIKEDNTSNWIARRATEEAKEKYNLMQKRINLLQINEGKQNGKQEQIDKKLKFLECVREKKNKDLGLLQRLKEEYYQRQVQISISAKNLREQLNQEIKMSKQQLQQQKRMDTEEIMRMREENNRMIRKIGQSILESKRQMSNRVRMDQENSFQAKCQYFNNKQHSQQLQNSEKRKELELEQNWLLTEISYLQQNEENARQRYNSLQVNRIEKETFMTTFMGIKQPHIGGGGGHLSTKNSSENSPTNTSKYQNSNAKFYFNNA